MSPDTVSSLYPDRPIRPLPRRRLRERLSADAVESIKFPPAPKTSAPLFYYPYSGTEDTKTARPNDAQLPSEKERIQEPDQRNYIARRNPEDADSDEDELAYRSRIYPRHTPDTTTGKAYRFVEKPDTPRRPPQPPGSTTSSADGYDSFENTNNKKKRKIPTPGDSGMNGSHLSSDLASMGISTNSDDIHARGDAGGGGAYYSPVSMSTSGFSGPGRGRYGRMRNGRSPLREASSNYGSGRSSKQRPPQWSSSGESTGIISNAIANAEKLPVTPSRGQENVGVLQQQASKKLNVASAQFTFTCDSQVPGTVPTQATMHQSPAARMSTQATHTSPGMTGTRDQRANPATPQPAPPPPPAPKASGPAPNRKKTRRSLAKEYKLAALQRRREQAYQNSQHPPAPEDIWICEFCEYEAIYGEPPRALTRQYEIKDRKEKRKAEEKRRLLEKAKMKGRKGKKGSKNGSPKNNGTTNPARHDKQPATQPAAGQTQSRSSQGTVSEEYYEDEYDDDSVPADGPPPLSPHSAPASKEHSADSSKGRAPFPETGPPLNCCV